MKALHIIPGLTNASGPTHALIQLVKSLEASGVDVSLAYLGNRLPNQIEPDLKRGEVFACDAVWFRHWGYSPELRSLLERRITEFDLLHIHSLWLYPSLIASKLARTHGIPYIIRPAGSLEPAALNHRNLSKRIYFALWERDVINHAEQIHAVSQQEQRNIESLNFAPDCFTIPNGIPPENFTDLPSISVAKNKLDIAPERPVITYVGRLHPIKGLEIMIPVVRSLKKDFPKLLFLVCGPQGHSYAQELASKFERNGILDSTRFLGEVDQEKKILAYRAADVAVLPSKTENFGIVAAEALAAETPVIASEHTPWSALKDIEAGDWIPLDPVVWARTIKAYLQSPEWRKSSGIRGRDFVMREFAWPEIGKRMKRAYLDILTARSTPRFKDPSKTTKGE